MSIKENIENMLSAIANKDYDTARSMFQDTLNQKVLERLDAYKVDVADQMFNGVTEEVGLAEQDFISQKIGAVRSRDNTTGRSDEEDKAWGKNRVKTLVKKNIDQMKSSKKLNLPEGVEQLDEISPGLAARTASAASDPEYDGKADASNIARMASKKFGKKIGDQIADTHKGHWPKEYGSNGESAPFGYDKMSYRQNRSTKPTMVTKDGKLTKTAQKGLKSDLKGN